MRSNDLKEQDQFYHKKMKNPSCFTPQETYSCNNQTKRLSKHFFNVFLITVSTKMKLFCYSNPKTGEKKPEAKTCF